MSTPSCVSYWTASIDPNCHLFIRAKSWRPFQLRATLTQAYPSAPAFTEANAHGLSLKSWSVVSKSTNHLVLAYQNKGHKNDYRGVRAGVVSSSSWTGSERGLGRQFRSKKHHVAENEARYICQGTMPAPEQELSGSANAQPFIIFLLFTG